MPRPARSRPGRAWFKLMPLLAGELLDAVVALVGNEDVPVRVHGDVKRRVELPVPSTLATPLGEERPGVREHLHAPVAKVGNEEVPVYIQSDALRPGKLPVPSTWATPFGKEGSGICEL